MGKNPDYYKEETSFDDIGSAKKEAPENEQKVGYRKVSQQCVSNRIL